MRLPLAGILLATMAWADLPLNVEIWRGDTSLLLSRYSVPEMASMYANSLGAGERDFTAKSELRGEGVVALLRMSALNVIGAVIEVTVRRGSTISRHSEYCKAGVYNGSGIKCAIQTGAFDAVVSVDAYPAKLFQTPTRF